VNTATRRPSRVRAVLAALLTTLLVAGGLSLTAAPANAAAGDVAGATLDWGIKASFRNYIAGPIAHGKWTVDGGVSAATPFAWSGGTGAANTAASTGSVGYPGSVHFQGHEAFGGIPAGSYALDLTVSNVRVQRTSATAAALVVDTVSNSISTPTVFATTTGVTLATVDLAAATNASTATAVAYTGAPTVLTAEGAAAFAAFYTAGTALDPVSFSWPVEQAVVVPAAQQTATVLSAPASVTAGQAATLTATVTPAAAAGTVQFFDGTTALASAPVASGTATTSVTLAAGTHGITAVFTPSDAALFVGSASAAASVVAVPAATSPTVTVSKTTVDAAGETVTVTGSGFSPAGSTTNGTRPPLAGRFGGAYVSFGKYADVWKPSAGAASSTRKNDGTTTKWAVDPADLATVGTTQGIAMGADGTFSVTMTLKPGFAGEPATGNYGIVTYGGSGLTYAPFETFTPITFVTTPTVTVSTTTLGSAGGTVTVTGTNFLPYAPATSGTRPPLAGKFAGTYVSFGRYADVWKPSANAPATARVNDATTTKWAVPAADVATIDPKGTGTGIPLAADGSFSVTFDVKPGFSGAPATGTYGIVTYAGGGAKYAAFETFTPITFAAAPAVIPTTTGLTATPAAVTVGDSTTLVATVSPAAPGTVTFRLGATVLGSVATSAAGTATFPVGNLPAGDLAFTAAFAPANALLYTASTGSATVVSAAKRVGAGSLSWGIKESFRSYVTGPIARGAITTSGVGSSGGVFGFGQAAGGTFDAATGVGTSNYSGSVRFTGHEGVLDVTIANPVVRIDSATQGTLLASINGSAPTPFATLDLAAAGRSTPDNTVAYAGVPAALTSQGAAVFSLNGSGFYAVGSALDPVSFVIGSPSTVSSAVGATVASFTKPRTAAPTPPATTGITVAPGTPLVEGGDVTITASGFQPNEKGILVVIYSQPTVLATNATADATGTVTWTGTLPAGLSGAHTLTLQGSVNRGVEVTIAAASVTAVEGCVVDDATMTWGFKESFRAYISGAIAKGSWTVGDGATYAVPNFGWAPGTGGFDPAATAGTLAFAGSIAFTGHDGVLNTTVANPQLRFVDADTAYLLLDVSGTTQDGAAVDSRAVQFAEIDLAGALQNDGGAVTLTAAPATLTAAGAAAFGTYPEGEELDPVTAAFTVAADCAAPVEELASPTSTTAVETTAADEPADMWWILWVALAVLVVAAMAVAVVVVRRRRA